MIINRSYNRNQLRADAKSRTLTGYACVFGERSVMLPDEYYGMVYEVVSPDAISDDVINSSDIIANINHNDDRMFGRMCNGKGSLKVTKDAKGLLMTVGAPQTVYGDMAYEGVTRGDFPGMSFAFGLDPREDVSYETVKEGDEEVHIRMINNIRALYDVSIVTHPAYPTTEVEARSAELRAIDKKQEERKEAEQAKRKQEAEASQKYISELLDEMK